MPAPRCAVGSTTWWRDGVYDIQHLDHIDEHDARSDRDDGCHGNHDGDEHDARGDRDDDCVDTRRFERQQQWQQRHIACANQGQF